ncbi:protein kinase [uncultured Jatrophihabitans sp.]|uniref:serine/threonine-protein kinase n=1 Tax=uncultured Jatrophihabitans sp. TaxID=1610747 RepID=UPI0035CBC1CC
MELLADRYRRVATLGEGAMGEVWLADDLVLGRRVAVKQLRVGSDAASVERMVREARTAARLHHPNAVSVHDLVTADGRPYLIMEYVEGETLEERLRRVGRLSPAEACAIGAQVARALEAAHAQGVVHRDVKPANVMITGDGRAKLADFGIARREGDTSLTATGHTIGTLAFMAPEAVGDGHASAASDVWSLGATVFAAVEGHPPYLDGDGATARLLFRLMTEPPPPAPHAGPAGPLLARMLDRSPERRPSAGEAARRLATAPTDRVPAPVAVTTNRRPITPPSAFAPTAGSTSGSTSRPRWGRTRTILAAVVAVIVVAAGLTAYLVTSGSDSPQARGSGSASVSRSPSATHSSTARTTPSASNTVSASPDALFANPTQVTSILASARTAIIALLSYDYRHLDEHDQQVSDLTTGAFHDEYLNLVRTAVDPPATEDHIVLSASVAAVGMGPFDGTTATVLVFDDTTRTDRTRTTTKNTYATVLAMRQVGGQWLVAGMEQDGGMQSDPPGSAGLAAATSSARRAAVLLTSLTKADVAGRLTQLRAMSTGDFRRTFDATTKAARTAAVGGEDSTGTVKTYGVASAGGSTADVLVDVKQTGTRSRTAYRPRRVRLDLTLTRSGASWLVSDVQNLG